MKHDKFASELTGPSPSDEHNLALIENVHPPEWKNPRAPGRYNLVVIGAGTAGLVAAQGAAALGAKVALIERNLLGGDCLNVGCVPSKTLIRSARFYADMRNAKNFGAPAPADVATNFSATMGRMRRIRARISQHDSVHRLTQQGVHVYFGEARFSGPDVIMVERKILRFKKALIATGARAVTPSIPGLAEAGYLTNETVFNLTQQPKRLLVIGGGPLGCELAQAFCRLGTEVIIVQEAPFFLPKEERDAAQILSDAFFRDGIEVRLNTKVVKVDLTENKKCVELVSEGHRTTVVVDEILVGAGRAPNVEGMNLETAGVEYNTERGVVVDDFLQTSNPQIYAAGDVCLEHKFTHTADASARIVVQNALFLGRKKFSALTIPWCTYTDPEIAHVGMYVKEAREKDIPVKTFTIPMNDIDRAITDGEEDGFVKIHVKEGTDQILGATVVARHAGEMINEISLAMVAHCGLRTLAQVIHAYPTQAEAIKKAADAYNRTRLTPFLKKLSSRWLAWTR